VEDDERDPPPKEYRLRAACAVPRDLPLGCRMVVLAERKQALSRPLGHREGDIPDGGEVKIANRESYLSLFSIHRLKFTFTSGI